MEKLVRTPVPIGVIANWRRMKSVRKQRNLIISGRQDFAAKPVKVDHGDAGVGWGR